MAGGAARRDAAVSDAVNGPQPATCRDPEPSGDLAPDRFEAVLRSISDGVFTIDLQGRITCFNRAAAVITGADRAWALGRPCHEVFRSETCRDACPLRYTLESGQPVVDLVVHLQGTGDERIPVSISTALFRDRRGRVVGAVATFRDLRQVEDLRRHIEERFTFDDIVSRSPVMRGVLDSLPTIAASGTTVLITGESGTGKELVARAIHQHSGRQQGPFVPVNCAGIPDTLLEAELFGYEAGAFTGASRSKPGRFARAEGGTLFLDEIGDMPMQLQAKLLRVLQDGTYEALGGVRARTADVRVVTATNRQLDTMVEQGTFRRDLYYRIKVFEIQLPPLHRRMEDVPLLVEHFIRRLAVERDKEVAGVTPAALQLLLAHDYPGNVRELYNAVIHGFVLTPNRLIDAHHLPSWLQPDAAAGPQPPAESLKDLERGFLTATLARHGNNRLATARALGIHKTTLYRKLHRLGVPLPDSDGRSHSGNGSGRG